MAFAIVLTGLSVPASAETPRDALIVAGFVDRDKVVASARVDSVLQVTGAVLARSSDDQEEATATVYRAKLTGNRGDAIDARR